MLKKPDVKKAAAISLMIASAVAGITFMAVTDDIKEEKSREAAACVSLETPDAGLSTAVLLSATGSDEISADFIYVSEVAKENNTEQASIVEAISDAISEIEVYVDAAAQEAEQYSEAADAYETALSILKTAESYKEAAESADTCVLAGMYVQDTVDLIFEAEAAAQEAEKEAEAAAIAEAEAAAAAKAAAHAAEVAALRQEIVSYACSFAGWLPYVHGGSSLTSGVDCSGFTAAIYAHFGYSLSHSSSVQSTQGRSVSLSEIQPGDIVVYSGHVALYIGGGQIVHAPGSGRTVTIASLYIMNILDVRRIIE